MEFASTDWSALIIARNRSELPGADAFARLLTIYQPAMAAHVRSRFRLQPAEADEIVQQFIVERLLEQNLLAKADRGRGRFRAFLVTSLNHFTIDWLEKRSNRPIPTLGDSEVESPVELGDPFEQAWAESVLAGALTHTAAELAEGNRSHYWELFNARVVKAAYDELAPAEYTALCQRLGFGSPRDASNALVTAKRTFERVLERLLSVESDGSVQENLADLQRILASRAARSR